MTREWVYICQDNYKCERSLPCVIEVRRGIKVGDPINCLFLLGHGEVKWYRVTPDLSSVGIDII